MMKAVVKHSVRHTPLWDEVSKTVLVTAKANIRLMVKRNK